jgi:hypothetical protein
MFESQNDGAAVNHHQPERTSNPPFVVDVIGEVAPNGKAIGLCIQRNEQGPVDLCLRSEDVQYFVGLFLALSHEARRLQSTPDLDAPPGAAIPQPINAVNVGRTSNGAAVADGLN